MSLAHYDASGHWGRETASMCPLIVYMLTIPLTSATTPPLTYYIPDPYRSTTTIAKSSVDETLGLCAKSGRKHYHLVTTTRDGFCVVHHNIGDGGLDRLLLIRQEEPTI